MLNLHRKLLQVPEGPVAFRIDQNIEVGPFFAQKFPGVETVVPEEPVGLVQSVFPEKGRSGVKVRQGGVFVEWHIGGEENPL